MTAKDLEKMAPKLLAKVIALSGRADRAKTTANIADVAYDTTIMLQDILQLLKKE